MNMKFILVVVATLICIGPLPAQANQVGSGPLWPDVTYDYSTGLQWLDVNLTENRTYNDIVSNFSNPSDIVYGYRYASIADIVQLVADTELYLFTPLPCAPCIPSAPINIIVNDLGYTFQIDTLTTFERDVQGLTSEVGSGLDSNSHMRYVLSYNQDKTTNTYYAQAGTNGFFPDKYAPEFGSFLVKDISTVPLPASLWFFVTGLGGLGMLRSKRSRRKAAGPPAV